MNNITNLSSLIWSSADDVLRGLFKPSEYGRVILPFVVMRRLDCVLEPKKDEVFELYTKYKDQLSDPTPVILRQVGYPFFNSSKFDLSRIKSDPNNVLMNFNNYVQGYSKNVLDIIENFSITPLVEKLHKNKRLYLLIDKFTEFDLHPNKIDNHQMGSVYEELLRKFSEMSNEESGDHFTPRDVVKLLVSFVFGGDRENLQGEGKIRSVFDPCCGTGGMLTIGKEWVLENINPNLKIDLYGQELNDVTYSICKSDLLMMNENPENIQGPTSSISDDRHQGRKFDYMITNPPFGVSWKSEESFVYEESKDPNGRFFVGTPTVKDGSFLFLQHLISKMNPEGSRIGIVFNGSPMFTGDANSGESNIRKWLIENDLIESITILPDRMFFNTDITTYVWILSNKKKPKLKNKIMFLDMSEQGSELERNLGDKGQFLSDETIGKFLELYKNIDSSHACKKIYDSKDFGYYRLTVDFPKVENEIAQTKKNGSVIVDPDLREVERIPLVNDPLQYFEEHFRKNYHSAIVDSSKIVVGYEINTNKFFAKDKSLRSTTELKKKIQEIDSQIFDMFKTMSDYDDLSGYLSGPRKFSGHEWLGEIPEHWSVEKIGTLYREVSVKNRADETPLSVFREYGVIRRDERDNKNVLSEDLSNYKLVEPNDLVLNKMKCWSGSLGVSDYTGIVSPSYIVLKPKFSFNNKFIHFLLRSQRYINQYNRLSYGVRPGQWDLRFVDFKNLPVVMPDHESQNKISEILKLKSELSLKIEELSKERDSLIYELRLSQVNEISIGYLK
jgi:type I restriction enzyme M protein